MQASHTLIATLALWLCVSSAGATQVQDLVRIQGSESAGKVTGMGLVVGLNDTGDGKKSQTTMRRLASMLNKLGDPLVTPAEIRDARNVAVVYISARVPAGGARAGDRVDVQVAAPFAESLAGGRLVMAPLLDPVTSRTLLAFAEGAVLVGDAEHAPNTGVIRGGATLRRDFKPQYMDDQGRLTLVLDGPNATWSVAFMIANLINDVQAVGGAPIARAIDQRNVVVTVPKQERANPANFISEMLSLRIDPSLLTSGARVVINQNAGTIVMTGDVEISPVVVSAKGITINIAPPADAAAGTRPTLAMLLKMLEAVQAAGGDRIAIVKELHRSGKLHAKLILED